MSRQRDLDPYLALVPAVVLCAVAIFHLWRWHREPVSSWRGGGFGMYADITDELGRSLKVEVLRRGWEPAQMGDSLTARVTNVRLNPTNINVATFADYLACNGLFLSQNPEARQIRVEYWQLKYEKSTSTIQMQKRLAVNREPCALD